MTLVACYDDDSYDACEDTVVTQTADDVDFAAIETFALVPEGEIDLPEDTEDYDNVRAHLDVANDAATEELLALGLTEVEPDADPDVMLFSLSATQEGEGTVWECVGDWVWWGWYWYWDACAWMVPMEVDYTVGTLVVGLADPVSEEVVFGGAVQGILECSDEPEDRIERGIAEIFEQYPQVE